MIKKNFPDEKIIFVRRFNSARSCTSANDGVVHIHHVVGGLIVLDKNEFQFVFKIINFIQETFKVGTNLPRNQIICINIGV